MTGDDGFGDDGFGDEEVDPERLAVCAYWRCGQLFERRSANHRYCRKACRSRQGKWERARDRKARRDQRRKSRPSKSPEARHPSM